MFTLDIKKNIIVYTAITIFVLIFSTVYAHYSHEVYSNYMKFAFVVPLVGELMLFILNKFIRFNIVSYYLLNSTVAIFTVGFIIRGIIVIYGTTNRLLVVYNYFGFIFLILFILCIILAVVQSVKRGRR